MKLSVNLQESIAPSKSWVNLFSETAIRFTCVLFRNTIRLPSAAQREPCAIQKMQFVTIPTMCPLHVIVLCKARYCANELTAILPFEVTVLTDFTVFSFQVFL